MITKEKKQELITKFGKSAQDTGSAEVQVAILTSRINDLNNHFKGHAKDHQSRRGLLKLVGARRSLLKYLQKNYPERYESIINNLDLRK